MKTDQAKQLAESALNQLMEALERGQSGTLKTYLSTMSRFHRYSWGNVLLIASQKPDATHIAGFQSWLKLNRHVKKGEKGIAIFAPMVGRKQADDEQLAEDEQTRLYGFRVAHVFDVGQTEGEPLPAFAQVTGDPRQHTERLKAFVTGQGITLEFSDAIAPAKGLSTGGKITLLAGMSAAEEFSVLAHEVAHEKLHRGERRTQTTKTVRETEAEAVAFVVCQAIGLDMSTASSDYIQLYSGDKATLVESLNFIQHTAAEILKAITSPDESAANRNQ